MKVIHLILVIFCVTEFSVAQKEKNSDSLQSGANNILKQIIRDESIIRVHPASIDSICPSNMINPNEFAQTNDINLNRTLGNLPQFYYFPIFISSKNNPLFYYGYPIPLVSVHGDGLSNTESILPSSSILSAKEVSRASYSPKNLSLYQNFFYNRTKSDLLWESGIKRFNHNILNVNFSRLLTEKTALTISTGFQNFTRTSYDRNSGGIYITYFNLYDFMKIDTMLMADTGTIPETYEQQVSIKLAQKIGKNSTFFATYRYADIKNDILFSKQQLQTQAEYSSNELSEFSHNLNLNFNFTPSGNKFGSYTFLNIKNSDIKKYESTNKNIDYANLFDIESNIKNFLAFNSDTLFQETKVARTKTENFGNNVAITHETEFTLSYKRNYGRSNLKGNFRVGSGINIRKTNDSLTTLPNFSLNILQNFKNQKLDLSMINLYLTPKSHLSISESNIINKRVDMAQLYNLELHLQHKKMALRLGYSYLANHENKSDNLWWLNGITPFISPSSVFMINPVVGSGKHFLISSKLFISDTKPYVKSNSTIRLHIHRKNQTQHLFINIALNYLSDRSDIYGIKDISSTTPIYSLDIATTLQIKTFRLFYKVDNLFNRRNSYYPGVVSPGILFRWGFNWQIFG